VRGVDPSTYTVFLATIVLVVAIGAFVVYRLKRDVEEDDAPVTDEDIAREFERAFFSGEMDEAEYRRVSESLRARKAGLRQTGPPAPSAPNAEPEPEPASDAMSEPESSAGDPTDTQSPAEVP
jgi:hypothetical protein